MESNIEKETWTNVKTGTKIKQRGNSAPIIISHFWGTNIIFDDCTLNLLVTFYIYLMAKKLCNSLICNSQLSTNICVRKLYTVKT